MNKRFTSRNLSGYEVKPLTRAIRQAMTVNSGLSRLAGGLLLVGCLGFNQNVAALNVSELDGTNGFAVTGDIPGARTGRVLSPIGDINGDMVDDFLIGEGNASRIVFGNDSDAFPLSLSVSELNGENGFTVSSGYHLSTVDINGDGLADLAFRDAYPLRDAFVVFGRDVATEGEFPAAITKDDLDGTNGFRITHQNPQFNKIESISSPGDISGDGLDDIALTIPYSNYYYGGINLYMIFGQSNASGNMTFPPDFSVTEVNGENGFRLPIPHNDFHQFKGLKNQKIDFNGDGMGDLFLIDSGGDYAYGNNFNARIIFASEFGNNGVFPTTVDRVNFPGSSVYMSAGYISYGNASFSFAGDVDNDDTDDVIVNTWDIYGNRDSWISLGAKEDSGILPGQRSFKLSDSYDRLSSRLGDINGDDIDDLSMNGVLFGRDAQTQGDFPAIIASDHHNGVNGFNLISHQLSASGVAGDFNNDGVGDIILSGSLADYSAVDAGRVRVIFGKNTPFAPVVDTNNLTDSEMFVIDGAQAGDRLGSPLTLADVNGDGVSDLIVAATAVENDTGAVYIVFGTGSPPLDNDNDGIGNNIDTDDDNDGVLDKDDAFPFNSQEWADTDGDGIGNNADPDDDNDGVQDELDVFPLDPNESEDSDQDGIGDNADSDDDNDMIGDVNDNCPYVYNPDQADDDANGHGNACDRRANLTSVINLLLSDDF